MTVRQMKSDVKSRRQ